MASNPNSVAFDPRALDRLRTEASASPDRALREAARQFEVLFMNMLLKSMRDAAPQDGPLDSDQTRMYTGLLDQQLAQAMAARGIGLADVMVRQLGQGAGAAPKPAPTAAPAPAASPVNDAAAASAPRDEVRPASLTGRARDFVNRLWPHAVEASRTTGIPAHFILGQAALESGWGTREIRGVEGAPTHNLFGIKAGRTWRGESAEATTTEYVGGVAQKSVARFRAYPSYAAAFQDYAALLKTNARYARVLESGADAGAFARELQNAGYATDPGYAAKLTRIITGSFLRSSLAA
jgi:flagellar protein FlgJ